MITENSPGPTNFSSELVLEMKGVVKRFPGVLANDLVDFDLCKGEVHALLGENGAGKSTLMNILAGLYRPDAGSILIHGRPVYFSSPREAIEAGIGMVHQHFMLVPSQTVTENILLGLDQPRFRMRLSQYDRVIAELGERFGLRVDPKARIWQLSVGEQQRVEILKMLYRGANILIMDEPTAVLAPREIDDLFVTLKTMVAEGKSIVFISHKLQEITVIADRVSVLRRGKMTANGVSTRGVTRQELARLMVGREILFTLKRQPQEAGEVLLSVRDLHAENDRGLPALRGVSFQVKAGEIVGLAGVAGNGQRELAQVISCLRHSTAGEVQFRHQVISNGSVRQTIRLGMAHVPDDRTHVGTSPNLSVTDNVIMKCYRQAPISHGWVLDIVAAEQFANDLKDTYEIIVPSVDTPVRLLSGGNLQRVILAREISGKPDLMIAVQPTRGLDVGAIEGVHRLLLAQRAAGSGILLISEELEELLSLSDRIYVIYEGRIMGEIKSGEMEEKGEIEILGMMMTGTPLEQIPKGEAQNG